MLVIIDDAPLYIPRGTCYNLSMYYTYLVRCGDGSLYAGFTSDLERRIKTHNAGKGAKYTRSRLPVSLAYYETFETEGQARSRECALKRMTRAQKLALVGEERP